MSVPLVVATLVRGRVTEDKMQYSLKDPGRRTELPSVQQAGAREQENPAVGKGSQSPGSF